MRSQVSVFGKFQCDCPSAPWVEVLIDYLGELASKPVVASAVGVNPDIVQDGVNGYLACTDQMWYDGLSQLLGNPELRDAMGRQGRSAVERKYCLQVTAPRMLDLLARLASARMAAVCAE